MEFFTAAKGLGNEAGQNNCFLNVVVQVLAHLQTFKEFFHMVLYEHVHGKEKICLMCEIRVRIL